MSDEAARRRELRKQRILGNSESRLKRILNKEELTAPTNQSSVNGGSEPAGSLPAKDDGDATVPPASFAFPNAPLDFKSPLISDLANDLDAPIVFPGVASMTSRGAYPDQQGGLLSSAPMLDMADLEHLSNAGDPMELFCRLAATLDENASNVSQQKTPYRGPAFLVDSGNVLRVRFVFFLGLLSRLLLPLLPVEYAKLFGPLYLLEILLFSLRFVYKAPLEHSSISIAYSLLSLCGIHPKLVKAVKLFTSSLELLIRDMWFYSFSFFVMHALCQQLEVFDV